MASHQGIPDPDSLMIVAAEDGERGSYSFVTSYYWLTFANGGSGRRRISRNEAARILRSV
ncbi:MAG: hypothetical protein ACI35N_02815 [Marinilabiliaceae bacterium]